jgi:cytochrome c peroxidase
MRKETCSAALKTPANKFMYMRFRNFKSLAALAIMVQTLPACNKDSAPAANTIKLSLPATAFNYNIAFPQHIAQALPQLDNTPANNPISNDGATLGRVLFYDKQLSKNNSISCASCHKAENGFSDNSIKSLGFTGGMTARHSMPILNLRFYRSGKMFWDERANSLEEQVLMPIQDGTEMGMTLSELVQRLNTLDYYPELFRKAFGTTEINTDRISKALAQFARSIVTYQSKYDRVKQGLETFTQDEFEGEQLFLTGAGPGGVACGGCHRPPMFLTSNPAAPFALLDPNDAGINNQNRFKSSTLRNIAQTTPLFHNGAVSSLQAMLAGNIPAHGVAPQDRNRILAFLLTLSDNTVTTEPKFADPFK